MDTIETVTRPASRWKKPSLIALGLVAVLGAAAGIAWAAGVAPAAFGHGGASAAAIRDHVEFRVHRALKQVNATQAQEDQILAIIDGLFAEHQQMAGERALLHQRAAAALTGATVDRVALEAVRVEALQRVDLASKDLVKAIGDIAEVLTPAQRQQLAAMHKH